MRLCVMRVCIHQTSLSIKYQPKRACITTRSEWIKRTYLLNARHATHARQAHWLAGRFARSLGCSISVSAATCTWFLHVWPSFPLNLMRCSANRQAVYNSFSQSRRIYVRSHTVYSVCVWTLQCSRARLCFTKSTPLYIHGTCYIYCVRVWLRWMPFSGPFCFRFWWLSVGCVCVSVWPIYFN